MLPVWCGEFKNLEPAAHALLLLLQIHGQVQSNAEWELALIDPSKKQLPPAATTRRWSERVDLEATCHCRLSLASTQARSRPSPSLTYYTYRSTEYLTIDVFFLHHPPRTQPHHQHTRPICSIDHLKTTTSRSVVSPRWTPCVPSFQQRSRSQETSGS